MKLRNCFIVSLCLLALTGCQSNSQETMAETSAVSETSAISETSAARQTNAEPAAPAAQEESEAASKSASVDLKVLTGLVGKSDSEVTAVLGQGEEMKNGDGLILERGYTLPLLGENANVSLSFNLYQEGANVLEQAVINLGQSDLSEYAQTLTQLFGEPTETYEKSYFFVSGGKTLTLADPYGDGAYIEISMGE